MVPADAGVIENEVVIRQPADPGGRTGQRMRAPGPVAQVRDRGLCGHRGALVDADQGVHRGGLRGLLDVQRLLPQDPLVQRLHRRPRIDAEVLGQGVFQPAVSREGIGLPLDQVVGGDQLRPQRLAVRVLGRQRLQFTDHAVTTPARDFGLGQCGVGQHLVFDQSSGERVDELEVPKVVEHRPAPLGQRGAQVRACRFELARRRRLHTGILPDDESAYVAGGFGDIQAIPRRRAHQQGSWVGTRLAEQSAQVRHIRVQAGPRLGRRPLFPRRVDQRLDTHRPVAVDHQHRQDSALLRCAQRHVRAVDGHLQRTQNSESETGLRHANIVPAIRSRAMTRHAAAPAVAHGHGAVVRRTRRCSRWHAGATA